MWWHYRGSPRRHPLNVRQTPRLLLQNWHIYSQSLYTHALTNVFSRKTEDTSCPSGLLVWSVSVGRHYGIGAKQISGHASLKHASDGGGGGGGGVTTQEGEMADREGGNFLSQGDESVSVVFVDGWWELGWRVDFLALECRMWWRLTLQFYLFSFNFASFYKKACVAGNMQTNCGD